MSRRWGIEMAICLAAASALCTSSRASIQGSPHDLSAVAGGAACSFCHTPHGALPGTPLWSRKLSTAVYKIYESSSLEARVGQPTGASKLCLSCHDGTVALENFGGVTSGTHFIDPSARIGGAGGNDLSTDHPISFEYTDALAVSDGGLFPPTTTSSGLGGTIDNDMLFDSKMECASCHDVHNRFGVSHLLKMSNVNSELCLTCHNK